MLQILEHVGEPTSAPAIASARMPPLEMKIGQELAAPEAVFEAIPELEFDQTENLRVEAGHESEIAQPQRNIKKRDNSTSKKC